MLSFSSLMPLVPPDWTATLVIDEIKKLWSLWPKWRFKFVPRIANGAAHALAKCAAPIFWKGC